MTIPSNYSHRLARERTTLASITTLHQSGSQRRPIMDFLSKSLKKEELERFWSWNTPLPEPVHESVHHIIRRQIKDYPASTAIHAWDGSFTYSELDALSTTVAKKLIRLEIEKRSIVALCFEKSKWMPVAMLGVIKAGYAAIALDTTQPDARLKAISQQAQPSAILCSTTAFERARKLGTMPILQINNAVAENDQDDASLPTVTPSDIVYITFTSGTTGTPKGACISHSNVASAVHYQGQQLGFHRHVRVYDFAPYSFDVAWSNFLHTLCAGGCLCIPREDDMVSDLYTSISTFEATLINITPTILRTIEKIPQTLQTVLLSGEMPYQENITKWARHVRLLNTYGPSECTFKCAFALLDPSSTERPDIGKGVGFATWIVDPQDSNNLVAPGEVGELCLEGPLVGEGYLNDSEKSAMAFIQDPEWLTTGSNSRPGRTGRVYKTGDLAKFKDDGRIMFIGRKDSQVKIRGQRVELGDVEHHVRACLARDNTIIAEAIQARDSQTVSLAVFIQTPKADRRDLKLALAPLTEKLSSVLPGFMIPSIYIPITEVPLASTGKVDRRSLRKMGSEHSWKELAQLQSTILPVSEHREPSTPAERALREAWADVLRIDPTHIGVTNNFFEKGGDSVSAMIVVGRLRAKGWSLTVGGILSAPKLVDMALRMAPLGAKAKEIVTPFSLLIGTNDEDQVRKQVSKLCGIEPGDIVDVFPCTPFQQGILALSAKESKSDYVSRTIFDLPPDCDIYRLEKSWKVTVQHIPILSTRIVDVPGEGLVQTTTRLPILLESYSEMESINGSRELMGLGTPLCRVGIVRDAADTIHLILHMHHAIFDGWITSLILDSIETTYKNESASLHLAPFQPFVKYLSTLPENEASEFWQRHLSNSEAVVFPSPKYTPGTKMDYDHQISGIEWPRHTLSASRTAILGAALSLLLSTYTNSSDIIFGAVMSGRDVTVPGIDTMAAPTIATIPVRVVTTRAQTVQDLILQIQDLTLGSTRHHQFGLHNIRRISPEMEEASQFELLLVVQPPSQRRLPGKDPLFARVDSRSLGLSMFNSYAMMMQCQLQESGVELNINFDSGAIGEREVARFASQFENALRQLCAGENANVPISDISTITDSDLDSIWAWNKTVPKAANVPVHETIAAIAITHPESIAVSSWDMSVSYRQLDELSTSLAICLRERGVVTGDTVVLCFEKSAWMPVAMLATLKAGATALPISYVAVTGRAKNLVGGLNPTLVLASSASHDSSFDGLVPVLRVDVELGTDRKEIIRHNFRTAMTDPAVILFSSGSTGAPKGILWSHTALAGNVSALIESFGLGSASRVFQFANYEFDVATLEILSTLSVGGCLCIPSESDRLNKLAGAINDAHANFINLTPSILDALTPHSVTSLKTVVVSGEKLPAKTVSRWIDHLDALYNWYGPAESSVLTSVRIEKDTWKVGAIGHNAGALTWLVDPNDPDRLAPIGAVAELYSEGPILADGYVGNDKSQPSPFFSPLWLLQGHIQTSGRRARVYRTGDLVKYDREGGLVFLGRCVDAERKLRGHRVDLADIEHHARSFLAKTSNFRVVAEIFSSGDAHGVLALFYSLHDLTNGSAPAEKDTSSDIPLPVEQLEDHLKDVLPSYTVPSMYIPVEQFPMTLTAKIDRRRLREIASSYSSDQLVAMRPLRRQSRKPNTAIEFQLLDLWSTVIHIEPSAICVDDHFLRLGGDSISAMRLVAAARAHDILLTVAEVFEFPQLAKMAQVARVSDSASLDVHVDPFSLLQTSLGAKEAVSYAAQECGVSKSNIEDIYPCTPLQEGLLAMTVRRPGQYVSRSVLPLQDGIDPRELRDAWNATVQKLPILRSRIVDFPDVGLLQVVLHVDSVPWICASDLEKYLREDEDMTMGLATTLCRVALIDRNLVLTIHHSTYDGVALARILSEIESSYFNETAKSVTPFQHFIRYNLNHGEEATVDYWKTQLCTSQPHPFPTLPSPTYEPQASETIQSSIDLTWARSGATPSAVIRSAWALITARATRSANVIYGTVVNGRQGNMSGIENVVGPTISTVPITACVNRSDSVHNFIQRTQEQATRMITYEQYGLRNIQRAVGDTHSSLFQTLLVVQPKANGPGLDEETRLFKARTFASNTNTHGVDPFSTYALTVVCTLMDTGLKVTANFDGEILGRKQAQYLLRQFEIYLCQLCTVDASTKLGDLGNGSEDEFEDTWAHKSEAIQDHMPLLAEARSQEPTTPEEKILARLWSQILQFNVHAISTDLNFFHIGDSISAMRLSGLARKHGLSLSVGDMFKFPRLGDMAKKMVARVDVGEYDVPPFSLMNPSPDLEVAASLCGVDLDDIEDLFPCTPLQEGLLALTSKRTGDYVGFDVYELSPDIDIKRFKNAWESVVSAIPILRACIIHLPGYGLTTATIKDAPCWSQAATLDTLLKEGSMEFGLGSPLMRCALCAETRTFTLIMHHAIYDGFTAPTIFKMLVNIYEGTHVTSPTPFQRFIKHVKEVDQEAESQYWISQFGKLEATQYPTLRSVTYHPKADTIINHVVKDIDWRMYVAPSSTIVRAAWAVVISRYTSSSDVVFGAISSGRKASVPGIESIVGPTIATVPIRIKIGSEMTVVEFLQNVQDQEAEMTTWEQTGLSRIRRISDEAQMACRFQSLLIVQPKDDSGNECDLFLPRRRTEPDRISAFASYALTFICTPESDGLRVEASFDSNVLSVATMERLVRHFEQVVRQLSSQVAMDKRVDDITMITNKELGEMWSWNPKPPVIEGKTIPDLFRDVVQKHPDHTAVDAWDGCLTYTELDQLSTAFARRLSSNGLKENEIIPMCFEKSVWVPVATMGVWKAGGATLMLDPSMPRNRIDLIMDQVSAQLIISSRYYANFASGLAPVSLVLDHASKSQLEKDSNSILTQGAKQDTLLYAVFTSGSTGVPKGCLMTHHNFVNAIHQQRGVFKLDRTSRVYTFSSYTFDAAYLDILHGLCNGSTLCVPNENERKDDLMDSVNRFHATYLCVTPSTARLIDPADTSFLRHMFLVGEAITQEDVARWLPYPEVIVTNYYGPAECTGGTVAWAASSAMRADPHTKLKIGEGAGCATWIVDVSSADQLVPVGTVGELVLEGPLVGAGYIDIANNTAFVKDPPWLLKGHGKTSGRCARLYRTGDLVKYDPADGSIIFVKRKDTQIKLRGQRIELAEIEHHVRQAFKSIARFENVQVIVEVIVPKITGRDTLIAFVEWNEPSIDTVTLNSDLDFRLSDSLPAYMIPNLYKVLPHIPLNGSGKTDRRKLRHIGSKLTLDELRGPESSSTNSQPITDTEHRLRALWAESLDMEASELNTTSSFLHYGDSISAMRLAALARKQNIALPVATILLHPRLSEMAKMVNSTPAINGSRGLRTRDSQSISKTADDVQDTKVYVARQCEIDASLIEDVFPCTAVQKSLIAVTEKQPGDYVARLLFDLKKDVNVDLLRKAWEDVNWSAAPILRCRLVVVPNEGLVQAQIKEPISWDSWDSSKDLDEYLEHDRTKPMGLSTPLARVAVAGNCCVLTIHHAIYDGHSIKLLMQEVTKAYAGKYTSGAALSFKSLIQHLRSIDKNEEKDFWRKQFAGAQSVLFPTLPSEDYQPNAQSTVHCTVRDLSWPRGDFTASTVIRTAWSILAARYTDSNDVTFGVLVTGRQTSVPGIENLVAPLIAALPVRVSFHPEQSTQSLLSQNQKQAIEMIPYEHSDLQEIRRIDPDSDRGSRFSTLLIVQPASGQSDLSDESPFHNDAEPRSASKGLGGFNPHALMIMCELVGSSGIRIEMNFDLNIIDVAQMDRIVVQFEHVLRQLCTSQAQQIKNVETVSQQDLNELWTWNANVPETDSSCVHDQISATARKQTFAPAICAWDGDLSYSELERCSNWLAHKLIQLGAKPGTIIPLCLEKSRWHAVAAIGVIKAGAACVSVDTSQPEGRLRSIVNQIKPDFVLASANTESLAGRLSEAKVVVLDGKLLNSAPNTTEAMLPKVRPMDTLYVVFTSGSTGTPKGVVTTHANFSSAAMHQNEALHVRPGTRVYDFVSYSFDVSWSNTLNTLIRGGCLCVPSEWERRNDIPSSLTRMKANYVYFTPSVAASLDPKSMPGIRTLAMGGEPIPTSEVARWKQCDNIIGIYGPAECAQALSITPLTVTTKGKHVGHSFGALTWLVEPDRPDRLAAIGTVGELMIEGPAVSVGYFSDKRRTEAVYLSNPSWLTAGLPDFHLGRHGKLYKTGDLLRYNSDGSLTFVGRKDGLIKLRGQRVELNEVEFHVQKMLNDPSQIEGVAAEVITPRNGKSPILAVFLSLAKKVDVSGTAKINGTVREDYIASNDHARLSLAMRGMESKLSGQIPQYMIPGAYILVDMIPMTTTNKTDRRALREIGNAKTLEDLVIESRFHTSKERTILTPMEKILRSLWASVLGVDAEEIDGESSFLRVGGESISAMRLVAAANDEGISLSVADIFKAPRLSELAMRAKPLEKAQKLIPKLFSLPQTNDTSAFIHQYVATVLDSAYSIGDVRDVVPVTDFQVQAITDALQEPPSRWAHWVIDLGPDVDIARLRRSCEELVRNYDILRTVFIEAERRYWQVFLARHEPEFETFECRDKTVSCSSFVDNVCAEDLRRKRVLGHSFICFMAIKHHSGEYKLIFRISHALFDGYSWPQVLSTLAGLYSNDSITKPTSAFAQYIAWKEENKQASLEHWSRRLHASTPLSWAAPACVPLKGTSHTETSNRIRLSRTISAPQLHIHEDVSPATVFHAACAIALSEQFHQTDLVFGRLVTGRAMLPAALQNVVGPTMTEVPIRVSLIAGASPTPALASMARQLQADFIEDSKHEAAGMVEIIKSCTDWPKQVHDFGWRTAFQQEEEGSFIFAGEKRTVGWYERELLPRDRPEVYATPVDGRLLLEFEGDGRVISEGKAQEFLERLRSILG
ncbi:acetyl-CoA synthetase-like protein [Massarina eburnea CBS 473.64]|uniref:Acetyl-CoA synthetase-like protein n=1 Tax=Massarina eburnea CBS 473.64 TaxID=1395130 RepID=A0A6A6RN10_9PLEO|nr:acetyl-CoA synthetase-like protein [Massarina eburnea CBS 473.64]